MQDNAEELYGKGQDAFKAGRTLEALAFSEKAFNLEPDNPKYQSFLGVCIAYERGVVKEAIELCQKALEVNPQKSENYLNLAKVYLRTGDKTKAVDIFRERLKVEKNAEIIAELQALGLRKKTVLSYFDRDHFLNKYLGIIFNKLGLR